MSCHPEEQLACPQQNFESNFLINLIVNVSFGFGFNAVDCSVQSFYGRLIVIGRFK
jgi:hypothetical protein